MARDISNGYLLVTERSLARLSARQMDQVAFEIEKLLREARSRQPDLADIEALRQRNQRIQRLNGGRRVIETARRRKRR